MNVLGLETSCDETAAAVLKDGIKVLANVVSSSINFHRKYGGIIPEIAFRKQLETIIQVVDCALKEAKIKLKDIDLISATEGPGLLGSLLVGISFAKAINLSWEIPFLGVNHLYSHIYSSFLNGKKFAFPLIALVVSGGHTSLYHLKDFRQIHLLGLTQDDACGEAFDKVAKILGLGYPGGPIIEKLAKKGDPKKIKFGCSNTKKALNFSFSGIKTAVLYYAQKNLAKPQAAGRSLAVADICASFQEAVIDVLVNKSILACRLKNTDNLVIGGGVAANNRLREKFSQKAKERGLHLFLPAKEYCTDNAAMVAGLGYRLYKLGRKSNLNLIADLEERG
jgi:N6-L-threonylcarbamoyladenine synthase